MDLRTYKLSPADLAEAKASLLYQPFRVIEAPQLVRLPPEPYRAYIAIKG